ncbi:hypothetical protein V6N11_060133 [Hibiscus sabdariffa]|uniref:Uncharacterized protein n=1 Tax=Hibiscus sabdariffa TaxID=183260 RepID=A0ABR2P325_9ROSI
MRITNEKESVGHVSNETDPTLGRPCNLAKEHEGNVDPPIGVEEWVFSDSKNSLDTDNVFDAAFEDEEIMDIWVKAKHKKKNLVSDELHVENEDEKASTSSPVVSASSTPSIILGPTTHVATEAITQAHETTPQAQLH